MNINVERFLALTAMLAAPLVAAPACVINDTGDSDTDASASNSNTNTNGTTVATGDTDPSTTATTAGSTGETADSTVSDTTAGDTTAGDTTAGDTTAADTGGNVGNCCTPDDHGAGCDVAEINDCVCGEDPVCCDTGWDMFCVMEVNQFGCGVCELPPTAWDCSCTTDCDGAPVDSVWQVCGADDVEAGTNGQAACEADLEMMGCTQFTCEECLCSTAEVPTIEC